MAHLNATKQEAISLPYSENGEKGVLSSLIHAPVEAGDICSHDLKLEHFYAPAHKIIYEVLLEWRRAGQVEFPWLKEEIKKRSQLEEVGGPEFLDSLYRFIDTGSNAKYYVDLVRDAWRDREAVLLGRKLAEGANFADIFEKLQAIDSEYQISSGYPPFESIDSLLQDQIDEPAERVAGLIHQGSKTAVGGGSKSYKTWLLTDLAVSIAAGVKWLGHATLQGRVLYVNLEIQRSFYRKRVEAIARAKQLPFNGVWRKNLDVWNLRGYCMDAESLCKILRQKLAGYALVVVDPLYKIVGNREENSNDQITSLLNLLESVARETGAAIAYGNHFSKGNQATKESIDRISGAGAFARDPDTILTLTRHESDGAYTVEATLRNFPPIEPFCVRWEYPLFVSDETLDPAKLKQPKKGGRPSIYSTNDLLECLGDRDLATVELQKLVHQCTGMSSGKFYALLKEGKRLGLLHQCGIDSKWEAVTAPTPVS